MSGILRGAFGSSLWDSAVDQAKAIASQGEDLLAKAGSMNPVDVATAEATKVAEAAARAHATTLAQQAGAEIDTRAAAVGKYVAYGAVAVAGLILFWTLFLRKKG